MALRSALAGGGPIADVGVHCVDSIRFILQDKIVRVSARATTDQNSGDVEASALLLLEFPAGRWIGAGLPPLPTACQMAMLSSEASLRQQPSIIEMQLGAEETSTDPSVPRENSSKSNAEASTSPEF